VTNYELRMNRLLPIFLLLAPSVSTVSASPPDEMTPESKAAIRRGLAWLVRNQEKDGSWRTATTRPDHMGLMGLSCVALMAAGNTPGRGEYGAELSRALDFIMKNAKPNGLLHIGPAHYDMYNHGLATLALAEAYGMSHSPRIKAKLVRAVDLIVDCQGSRGGWQYVARPGDHDTSLCVMQMMALRAAINSGIYVPKETVDKAVKYLLGHHNRETGGFGYSGPAGINVPMSSAGAVSLQAAGKLTWDSKEGLPVRKSLDWLLENSTTKNLPNGGHGYYATYYYAQAMYQAGDKYWRQSFPRLRDNLVKAQSKSGYWKGSGAGPIMATSIAVMVLCIPNRYLPIFQEERD
ncbi:MAG: terpene cyclase/mutase family protein, partial [Planctomycetota bacterium]|nr:terpene cyclase/mutase family protein [Planctomycetota bacterium]